MTGPRSDWTTRRPATCSDDSAGWIAIASRDKRYFGENEIPLKTRLALEELLPPMG